MFLAYHVSGRIIEHGEPKVPEARQEEEKDTRQEENIAVPMAL
jgi:hypothetical protein